MSCTAQITRYLWPGSGVYLSKLRRQGSGVIELFMIDCRGLLSQSPLGECIGLSENSTKSGALLAVTWVLSRWRRDPGTGTLEAMVTNVWKLFFQVTEV